MGGFNINADTVSLKLFCIGNCKFQSIIINHGFIRVLNEHGIIKGIKMKFIFGDKI